MGANCSCMHAAASNGVGHREKLQGLEAKHRTLVQDKNNLQGEKAAMERELKVLRGQAGKLTKVRVNPQAGPSLHQARLAEGLPYFLISQSAHHGKVSGNECPAVSGKQNTKGCVLSLPGYGEA